MVDKKKILVVDDSKTIRQQVGFTLTNAGFDVVEAEDGHDGIAKLEANVDINMIISDVNMPNMDGLEMVEKIRNKEEFKTLPIILLTTESSGEKVDRAKNSGAIGWLVKPFNPEQLVGAVKKLAK